MRTLLVFFFTFFLKSFYTLLFFKLMRGERIKILQKAGHNRPASEMPFEADDGPTLNAGLVAL